MQINLEGKNKLYKTKECVQELVDQILGNEKTILEINLTGNVFYIEAMDYLFDHISKIEKLQKCILIGVLATLPKNIMLSNLKIISTKLPTKHLEVLDLSDNALSCELPEEFRTFFYSLKCLKILHLNNCGLGEKGGIWLAETLLGMKNKKSLNVIQLAQNKFIKFPKNLEVALDFHECLEEIRIQYNTIQMGDMETFISALGNLKLRVLDVRDNNLNLNSCEMLGKFYQNWEIEELYLGSCCLNDKSIHLFLKHASKKENVLSLHDSFIQPTNKFIFDISNNDITQEGIDEIKEFIKDRVIDKLFIQGNEYDDCTELVNLVSKKGGKVVHDNEDDIEYEDISLIQKFEEALSKNKF